MSNGKSLEWWLRLVIAILSAVAGAVGGGAAVACGAVVI